MNWFNKLKKFAQEEPTWDKSYLNPMRDNFSVVQDMMSEKGHGQYQDPLIQQLSSVENIVNAMMALGLAERAFQIIQLIKSDGYDSLERTDSNGFYFNFHDLSCWIEIISLFDEERYNENTDTAILPHHIAIDFTMRTSGFQTDGESDIIIDYVDSPKDLDPILRKAISEALTEYFNYSSRSLTTSLNGYMPERLKEREYTPIASEMNMFRHLVYQFNMKFPQYMADMDDPNHPDYPAYYLTNAIDHESQSAKIIIPHPYIAEIFSRYVKYDPDGLRFRNEYLPGRPISIDQLIAKLPHNVLLHVIGWMKEQVENNS